MSRRLKYQKIIDKAVSDGAIFVSMNDADFRMDFLKTLSMGSGLFGDSYIVLLTGVLENPLWQDIALAELPLLASTSHTIIFNEQSTLKPIQKIFEKNKAEIISLEKVEKKEKSSPSVFAISDAFGARDRKTSWLLYRSAAERNVAPEEIHGIIFWIVKAMLLSHKDQGLAPSDTKLNPFVYKKARTFSSHFKKDELEGMARELVGIYHRAHMGETDFESALELFLLKTL